MKMSRRFTVWNVLGFVCSLAALDFAANWKVGLAIIFLAAAVSFFEHGDKVLKTKKTSQ